MGLRYLGLGLIRFPRGRRILIDPRVRGLGEAVGARHGGS